MSTTITTVKGWHGLELRVGIQVQVHPEAEGWNGTETKDGREGTLERIYANGEEVKVRCLNNGAVSRLSRSQVRPFLTEDQRMELHVKQVEELDTYTRKRLSEWLHDIKCAHLHWIEKLKESEDPHCFADRLCWDGDSMLYGGAKMLVLRRYGIEKAVQAYLDELLSIQDLWETVQECCERAAHDALCCPYRHSSTTEMRNLQNEVEHRVLCELGSAVNSLGAGGGTWLFRLEELKFTAQQATTEMEEW